MPETGSTASTEDDTVPPFDSAASAQTALEELSHSPRSSLHGDHRLQNQRSHKSTQLFTGVNLLVSIDAAVWGGKTRRTRVIAPVVLPYSTRFNPSHARSTCMLPFARLHILTRSLHSLSIRFSLLVLPSLSAAAFFAIPAAVRLLFQKPSRELWLNRRRRT